MELHDGERPMPTLDLETRAAIGAVAVQSALARYRWKDRGVAPPGYVKGMAMAYGDACFALMQGDPFATVMATAPNPGGSGDALNWYGQQFSEQSTGNSVCASATLRRLFVLLTGLGMRESSGRACEGRDLSADNTTAATAEAGLFQSSYNLHSAHPLVDRAIRAYANSEELRDVFMEGVKPKPSDAVNVGVGMGLAFQLRTKRCPVFAVVVAAIGLRQRYRHWGPIKRREAELRPECNDLFLQIEGLVNSTLARPTGGPDAR